MDTPTDSAPTEPAGDAPAGRRLRLDHREDELSRGYVNAFRTFASADELVVDLGFNLVRLDAAASAAAGDADGTVTIDWTQRTVMSYRTAKSLAVDLARILREHERVNGEIATGNAPATPPAGEPG